MKCANCKTNESDGSSLCKDCSLLLNEGYIDRCECGSYKEKEYDLCNRCYEKRKPYKDVSKKNKVPNKIKKNIKK